MSKTVNSWQKATASNKRLGDRISRILARLQIRTVRRAFEAWYPRMLKEDESGRRRRPAIGVERETCMSTSFSV
jgi:hypothetical protein